MSKNTEENAIADDLDDGLVYDFDVTDDKKSGDSEEEVQDVSDEPKESATGSEEKEDNSKKRKKNDKLKEKKRLKMEIDTNQKKNISLESSTDIIADYLNNRLTQKNPDLSALELSELYFKKSDIRSTAEFTEERNLENLPKFISSKFKNMLPEKKKGSKNKKNDKKDVENDERKFIVILSMSALRACDVHRATRELAGSSIKLINKNKLPNDLKILKTTNSRVLCCTPGRLLKILNNNDGELKKEELKILIVDNSFLDPKLQNVWDIAETTATLGLLTKEANSKIYLY